MSEERETCRSCALRRARGLREPCSSCAPLITRPVEPPPPPVRTISEREPLPAEDFDPLDVLETSIRQARRLQRLLQVELDDEEADVERGVDLHGRLAKAVGELVPTWLRVRDADKKKREALTDADMEDALISWFNERPASRQREIAARLSAAGRKA